MSIGYGSITSYDSIRHDLFFDETTSSAYFEASGRKYIVKLNNFYITNIKQNKKIWITLTQQMPRFISSNTEFNENDITVCII